VARRRKSSPDRIRVGKVSLYLHHGSWYAYYRESGRPIRVRLTTDQAEALAAAEEIDRNLSLFRPSPFGQRAISLEELRRDFWRTTSTSVAPRWRRSIVTARRPSMS